MPYVNNTFVDTMTLSLMGMDIPDEPFIDEACTKTEVEILKDQNAEMKLALQAVRGAFLTPVARAQMRPFWNEYHQDAMDRTMKVLGGFV